MILCLDEYTVFIPSENGFEVTIKEDYYRDYTDIPAPAALAICGHFIVGNTTHRPVGHIPMFKKIPLAIAMALRLKKGMLIIDQGFETIFADLLNSCIKING